MNAIENKSKLLTYSVLVISFALLSAPGAIFFSSWMGADASHDIAVIIKPDITEIDKLQSSSKAKATPETAHAEIGVAETPQNTAKTPAVLIHQFDLIHPSSEALCNTNNPWLLGEVKLDPDSYISANNCFAVKISLEENTHYYLFLQDSSSHLYKLSPNKCPNLSNSTDLSNIFVPTTKENHHSVFAVDSNSSEEQFYLVAYNSQFNINQLAPELSSVPGICSEAPEYTPKFSVESLLKHLSKTSSGNFNWKNFRLYH